ncbi:MAG TPA: hypothetical protein ENN23_02820 [Deltaproteobacteria bacterium]|mgnify:CR=1 FL=1|nr:hypothetical protein [Deltaproteobacteria bacterium]
MSRTKKKIIFAVVILAVFIQLPTLGNTSELLQPVLSISPREINLGTIASGEASSGLFTLRNMGSGVLEWSTSGSDGWLSAQKAGISNVTEKKVDYLRVEVRLLATEEAGKYGEAGALHFVEMNLESETGRLVCRQRLSEGKHKEAIRISSTGGFRTIFVSFTLSSAAETALIDLNPVRLDMGSILPGESVSKRIMLTNKGRKMLNWSVAVQKPTRGEIPADFKNERYLSFHNEDVAGGGNYLVPSHLGEMMEITGKWTENEGYPSGEDGENTIRLRFSGTGIILCLATYPDIRNLNVFLNGRLVSKRNWNSALKEKKGELPIAEGLDDGSHVLTITTKDSRLVFEGVKILGNSVTRAPAGRTIIVPTSGATLTQTNYLRVTFNSRGLAPGLYGDNIIFTANDTEATVEVFVEVMPESAAKEIDVFRYSRGDDYLYTSQTQKDTLKFSRNNYTKDGIAFRLFAPGAPGTTPFYRWYHDRKRDHFYHHERSGGGKNLQGYEFEGSIGNIATSKLTNTRELYRWYNPSTDRYFYTTDSRAANIRKKGYSFDGIAGYVK